MKIPYSSHFFEVQSSLSHIKSHFYPDHCPNILIEYKADYDDDYNVMSYKVIAIWEEPHYQDKHLDSFLITLQSIPEDGWVVIDKVVLTDAEDRSREAQELDRNSSREPRECEESIYPELKN